MKDKKIAIGNDIVYTYKKNLYVNLTNKCTAGCLYCIKNTWAWQFRGHNLKIAHEPTAQEVINSIKLFGHEYKEVVYCGYGEPFLRLDVLKESARILKEQGYIIRVNTSGHGNLIHKRNIVPELKGWIDSISISLNAENPEQYICFHNPVFGLQTFDAILDFTRECKKYIPEVILTTINLPLNWKPGMEGINIDICRNIAKDMGVEFRVRPFLKEYENS